MTGAKILQFPVKPHATLTKRQLARALARSPRWIEMRTKEGMPASHAANGSRRYVLADVLNWLDEGGAA